MAKEYAPPLEPPAFNFDTFREDEEQYIKDLRKIIKKKVKSQYAGDLVQFPVADGYAIYMIVTLKPASVIHVPIGDAWQIPTAHMRGLTAADLKKNADRVKRFRI